jgi:hypothetical protein
MPTTPTPGVANAETTPWHKGVRGKRSQTAPPNTVQLHISETETCSICREVTISSEIEGTSGAVVASGLGRFGLAGVLAGGRTDLPPVLDTLPQRHPFKHTLAKWTTPL